MDEPEPDGETTGLDSDKHFDSTELRKLPFNTPQLEVKELEELPENWRRSKLAWLCKELPSHKRPTMTRLLNANRKWIKQKDATYLAVHCMRIRENEAGFWVYKWMSQQNWFRFDFVLATKLADYMGRERKFSRCREMFDDIINQGRVPSESTFHILIVAYLSAPGEDCLEQACEIYNRMIHLGGYRPRLALHNALFRAIVSRPGITAKQYLKQAEFIFHNLVTSELEIHKDIYAGLLWLHSYQDTIDKKRMSSLRNEMHLKGIEESRHVLLSILRACSKEGDVDEADKTWLKLHRCDGGVPSQAYAYKMEAHAKVGDSSKSLKLFREMQEQDGSVTVAAYHKIIEIMCRAQEVEIAESLMEDFIRSNLKPLVPSYLDLLNMYFKLSLHNKVESTFFNYLQKCQPNRTAYAIYLDSLLQIGNIEKAESIFQQMLENDALGVHTRSCNTILSAYLSCGDHVKAEKMYAFMCQKKYEVESSLMEKLELVFSSRKKVVQKSVFLKLTPGQREILAGLLLGGLRVERAQRLNEHFVCFEFKGTSSVHSILKRHVHTTFREWLQYSGDSTDDDLDIPSKFSTVPHLCFGFYADQFCPNGRQAIPKLIHRWLSPRVLAYWYMYGGYRISGGDILLKAKGSRADIERLVKALKLKSLDFRVRQKGRVVWLGFLGSNSTCFWRLIEPYILDGLKDLLRAGGEPSGNRTSDTWSSRSDSDSDLELLDSDSS